MKPFFLWTTALSILLSSAPGWAQETAEGWFNKGVEAVKAQRYEAAIQYFEKNLALHPNHEESYRHIGLAYIIDGMWDEGIEAYRKAIEINPRNPQTHYDLGFSLYKKKAFGEAVEEFKRAIELDAGFVPAYQALGALYAENETLDRAIPQFKKALELSPSDPAVHWNLAEAYSESGKHILAADHYYHVGVLSLGRGDREAALAAYEKALPFSPEIAAILLERLYSDNQLPDVPQPISEQVSNDKSRKTAETPIVIGPFPSDSETDKPRNRLKARMNVREKPSLDSKIVGQLDGGGRFRILEEADGNNSETAWYRIEGEMGIRGWLCGIYKGVVQYETVSSQ